MERLIVDSSLLGSVRQANPKCNDLKHCLDAACKTRHSAGCGGLANSKQIRFNPQRQVTNTMQYLSHKLARQVAIFPAREKMPI